MGKCTFAIVFMDCNMPFMDGFEATVAIRNLLWSECELDIRQQPIISALTGHAEEQYIKKCYDAGMN